jgi:urease accessory protein
MAGGEPAGTAGTRPVQPRAEGHLSLASKARGAGSALDRLRAEGALKALFPRRAGGLEAIVINTAGGLTGGDRLTLEARAGAGSSLCLTTQAAERAYRAAEGVARVETQLVAEAGAELLWLPQELILYEGARLQRRLRADLAPDARLLLVEPVIFGRAAMGERLHDITFRDRIEIRRAGQPLYGDGLALTGDAVARMARPALGRGAGAMAQLVFVAPEARGHLSALRAALPETGGASLLAEDVLLLRLLAEDGHALRQSLLPILDRLSRDRLPTSWRL